MPRRDRPDDIVRAFVRRLAEAGMPKVDAVRLELELRDEYGGKRFYIPKPPPATPAEPRRKPQHSPLPDHWNERG